MIIARAAIFDVDGTLIDTLGRFYAVFNELLRKRGIEPLAWDDFLHHYIEDSLDDVISPAPGGREEALHEFWLDFLREYRAEDANGTIIPGARETLASLSNRGIPIAAVTSCIVPAQELVRELSEFGMAEFVDAVVTGADVLRDLEEGHHFSKREIFSLAARRLGVDPSDCVIIGDYWNDIRDAKAIGARAVAVLTGLMKREALLRFKPDSVIESVAELLKVVEFISRRACGPEPRPNDLASA